MGNNISGLNPIAGVTVEQILVDFGDWNHIGVLGSSRFFKVSKVKKENGKFGVLKVFKYPEGTKTLVEKYQSLISSYFLNNTNLYNVLPYTGCSIIKETVCLWRSFVHYSLSERLLTRPFLRVEEKKWIAFQILCGLTQCHKERLMMHYNSKQLSSCTENRLCHGDIKTENILLTDWGWVFLADMAPFKPVYIPDNNPSEFYFYFDISGKRACYVAPERFVNVNNEDKKVTTTGSNLSGNKSVGSKKTNSTEIDSTDSNKPYQSRANYNDPANHILLPSMDMFSVGCVLIELFTDGVVPFNLADLFNYRDVSSSKLNQLLKKIKDDNVKEMVQRLLSKSPETRISAEECLISQRGKTFPDIFYRELKGYMVQFLSESMNNSEFRINRLYNDFPYILKTYVVNKKHRSNDNGTLILFVNLITSVIFTLEEEQSKIKSLLMLKEIGLYLIDEVVLDRIIPYLLEFVDPTQSLEVRRTALDCSCLSVADLKPSSASDICFFPDYFLPAIGGLQRDSSISIQYAFTRHIPLLAKVADRFLQDCVNLQRPKTSDEMKINYDTELQHLWEIFREMIINLFASEQNVDIKCCVTERQYLQDLTSFFRIGKARDDLLSHLITFLNDNTNHIVRLCFYRCIPDVIEIMGVQSARILDALLIRGLQDPHLRVIETCCRSLAVALRQQLIPHKLRSDVLTHVVPLLALPYISLRLSALDFVVSFCTSTPFVTVLTTFLKLDKENCIFRIKEPVSIQNNMECILWSNLYPPINKAIFDDMIRCGVDLDQLFSMMNEKQKTRHSQIPIKSGDVQVDSLYDKFVELGMTDVNEKQILLLKNLIATMNEPRRQIEYGPSASISTVGTSLPTNSYRNRSTPVPKLHASSQDNGEHIRYFSYKNNYNQNNWKDPIPEAVESLELEGSIGHDSFDGMKSHEEMHSYNEQKLYTDQNGSISVTDSTWKNLFDTRDDTLNFKTTSNDDQIKLSIIQQTNKQRQLASDIVNSELGRLDETDNLLKTDEDTSKFRTSIYKGLSTGSSYVQPDRTIRDHKIYLPTAWKPKGILVGHLHEHRRGYTTVLAHPTDKQMISCGTDRSLKFWNCDPSPGRADPTSSKYIPNKSSHSLTLVSDDNSRRGGCQKIVWTDKCNSIAAVVDGRFINIVERSGEMRKVFEFPSERYGLINSVTTCISTGSELDSAAHNTLIYSTTGNWLVAHDLRCPLPTQSVWTMKQNNDYGMITSVAAHSCYTWLTAGTSRGSLVCWDMRFQRVVNKMDHPDTNGFLNLAINPLFTDNQLNQDHEDNYASSLSNSHVWASCEGSNEISCWNVDSCSRTVIITTPNNEQCSNVNANLPSVASVSRNSNASVVPQRDSVTGYRSRSFVVRLVGPTEQQPCIISGSTDCHLRYWDLLNPHANSKIISHGGLNQYTSVINTETKVLHNPYSTTIEQYQQLNTIDDHVSEKYNIQPFTGHVSGICDLTTINLGQPFIVSSSMDGIIKIWK